RLRQSAAARGGIVTSDSSGIRRNACRKIEHANGAIKLPRRAFPKSGVRVPHPHSKRGKPREADSAGGHRARFVSFSQMPVRLGLAFVPERDKDDVFGMSAHADWRLSVELLDIFNCADVV